MSAFFNGPESFLPLESCLAGFFAFPTFAGAFLPSAVALPTAGLAPFPAALATGFSPFLAALFESFLAAAGFVAGLLFASPAALPPALLVDGLVLLGGAVFGVAFGCSFDGPAFDPLESDFLGSVDLLDAALASLAAEAGLSDFFAAFGSGFLLFDESRN